jgi:hypothetical protein
MEEKSPQGMKVPLIVMGVAVLAVAVGILVRSGNSPSSTLAPESTPALAPEPAPLPVAWPSSSSQIKFSSLAATDDQGDAWTLGLKGVPPRMPEDGTKPGAPLCVKADVNGSGVSISIGLIIEGQAGEVYEPGAAKNGTRRPAPKFTVLDESGKVLGSGSFEYG